MPDPKIIMVPAPLTKDPKETRDRGVPPVPEPNVAKIKRLSAKVAAHRANHAGTLRSAFDHMEVIVKALAQVDTRAEHDMEEEIDLLLKLLKRFQTKMKMHQQVKTGALAIAMEHLAKVERLLLEAQGHKGYKVKALKDKAQVDLNRAKQVRASLQHRSREAAFVLAELEQAVDPFPGIKMVSAAARKRHDAKRKAALTPAEPLPPVELSDGVTTS